MATINKTEVFNPISMFNTVGLELEYILSEHEKDKDSLLKMLGYPDFQSIKRLNKSELSIISNYLKLDTDIELYFKNFQTNYFLHEKDAKKAFKESKVKYNRLKSALPLLYGEFTDGIDVLEDITNFFGKDTEDEVFQDSKICGALFREQNNVPFDEINLKAWLRRGELDFQSLNVTSYNKEALLKWVNDKEWANHIEDANYFKSLPDIFRSFGVALVFVQFLPKTVYGAVRWFNGVPLIQVSDRTQDLATCWYTLFHEIGHVILHENDNIFEGQINDSKTSKSKKEVEANRFANYYLFKGDNLRKEVFNSRYNSQSITSNQMSAKHDVPNLMVAYWFRKAQIEAHMQQRIQISFQ